jgi:hypothetical protein
MITMKRILTALTFLALAGCQTPDAEIRADIAGKAQQDMNFAGLHYVVKNGVVDFTGSCSSEKALAKIKQLIENIHVIKSVSYHVSIQPVVLGRATYMKLEADSILAQYPEVTEEASAGGIILKGQVTAQEKTKVMAAFIASHIKPLKDSIIIR